jgi:hypothetical protein
MNIISFDIGTNNFVYTILTANNELDFKLINLDGRVKNIDSLVIGRCQILTEIVKEAVSYIPECPLGIFIENQVRASSVAINLMNSLIAIVLNHTVDILLFVPNQQIIFLK